MDGNHQSDPTVSSYTIAPGDLRRISAWSMPNSPTNAYEIPMARPIVKGKMYARGMDGHIYCYDVSTSGTASVAGAPWVGRERSIKRHTAEAYYDMRGRRIARHGRMSRGGVTVWVNEGRAVRRLLLPGRR